MKDRLYTAAKPTGRLTLGNYIGAVDNWLQMQEEYDSIFCVADLHSLTVEIDPKDIKFKKHGTLLNLNNNKTLKYKDKIKIKLHKHDSYIFKCQ